MSNIVSKNAKNWAIALCSIVLASVQGAASAADISGPGATFPSRLREVGGGVQEASDVSLNYQSIGSGGGIKQIEASTVTFGASDKPLEPAELEASGLVQWPMIIGGVVPAVNIPGVKPGELVLDGPTLADIYLGTITKWNDAAHQGS